MKKICTTIVIMLIGLASYAQIIISSPNITKTGCPTPALGDFINVSSGPGHCATLNPINPYYVYKECYNCDIQTSDEINVCQPYFDADMTFKCPQCLNIVRLDGVFNPKTNTYETIYVVKSFQLDGTTKVFYTYQVVKVPIYATRSDGTRVIVGYYYEWLVIPGLTTYVYLVDGSKKMIFE